MLERLESRQLFSVTLATNLSPEAAPPPAVTVDASAAKKPQPKPATETYLKLELENVLVSSY